MSQKSTANGYAADNYFLSASGLEKYGRYLCTKPTSCKDSDGNNISTQGQVYDITYSQMKFDSCYDNTGYATSSCTNCKIGEYTCSGIYPLSVSSSCSNCLFGKCLA